MFVWLWKFSSKFLSFFYIFALDDKMKQVEIIWFDKLQYFDGVHKK